MSVFTIGSAELQSSDETETPFTVVSVLLAGPERTITFGDINLAVQPGDNLGRINIDATNGSVRVTFNPVTMALAAGGKAFEVRFVRKDASIHDASVSSDGTPGGDIVQLSQQNVAVKIGTNGAILQILSEWNATQ